MISFLNNQTNKILFSKFKSINLHFLLPTIYLDLNYFSDKSKSSRYTENICIDVLRCRYVIVLTVTLIPVEYYQ